MDENKTKVGEALGTIQKQLGLGNALKQNAGQYYQQQGVCPTCHTCPTCGRRQGLQPYQPFQPWYGGVWC